MEEVSPIVDFAVGGCERNTVRNSDAVQAADRRKHTEFEPADKKFGKSGIVGVALVESTDIGRPPADSRHGRVQSRSDLGTVISPCRPDVAGPQDDRKALPARPCRATQEHRIVGACLFQAFGVALRMEQRIGRKHLRPVAEVGSYVFRIGRSHLGFAGIQPEVADAPVEVVPPGLVPVEVTGIRVEGIVIGQEVHPERVLVGELDHRRYATLCAQEVPLFAHLDEVLRVRTNRRPDRDDGLHAHFA